MTTSSEDADRTHFSADADAISSTEDRETTRAAADQAGTLASAAEHHSKAGKAKPALAGRFRYGLGRDAARIFDGRNEWPAQSSMSTLISSS
jgi:hypothetical protein